MEDNIVVLDKKEKKAIHQKQRSFFRASMRKNANILSAMVRRNFKSQYRNSILGAFWTVLNPLLNTLILSFVFSGFFGGTDLVYAVYIFSGNLIFNIMRQITAQSLECLVSNSDLIKKVKISYAIFPVSNMFTALVNFGVAFIALLFVMLIVGQTFHWEIVFIITLLPAVLLFSLGVGFVLSSMFVFFRDIKHLYDVFLTLWMYMTPIFYNISMFEGRDLVVNVITINPMYQYVTMFRNMIGGVIPSATTYLIAYAWAIGMVLIGYTIFKLNRKKYILYI